MRKEEELVVVYVAWSKRVSRRKMKGKTHDAAIDASKEILRLSTASPLKLRTHRRVVAD